MTQSPGSVGSRARRSPSTRTPQQTRRDHQVSENTREAVGYFQKHRVPGITYKVTTTIDLSGSLVLTWSPADHMESSL